MLKIAVVILAVIASAVAQPGLIGAPLAYTAPAAVVAAPAAFATATSSQYIARNHNGLATAAVVSPIAAGYTTSLGYSAPGFSYPLAYSHPSPVLF